jgi:predicted DNA-binding ribbon-helix-helix protein
MRSKHCRFGIVKRSVHIKGRKTSISLEDEFWDEIKSISQRRATSLSVLLEAIDTNRRKHGGGNLSSAIRLYVLDQAMKDAA